uniref:Uncharacterized protein n=1 Tax=Plectus sambesii TaxID=2011161 RepID=A0A914VHE2_9BILA
MRCKFRSPTTEYNMSHISMDEFMVAVNKLKDCRMMKKPEMEASSKNISKQINQSLSDVMVNGEYMLRDMTPAEVFRLETVMKDGMCVGIGLPVSY